MLAFCFPRRGTYSLLGFQGLVTEEGGREGRKGRGRGEQVGVCTGADHKRGTKRIRTKPANSEQGTGENKAVETGHKPVGSTGDASF